MKKFSTTFTKPVQDIMGSNPGMLVPVMRFVADLQLFLVSQEVPCTDPLLRKLFMSQWGCSEEYIRLRRCVTAAHRCCISVGKEQKWNGLTFTVSVQFYGFSETAVFATLKASFRGQSARAISLHEEDAGNGKPLQTMQHAQPAHQASIF